MLPKINKTVTFFISLSCLAILFAKSINFQKCKNKLGFPLSEIINLYQIERNLNSIRKTWRLRDASKNSFYFNCHTGILHSFDS